MIAIIQRVMEASVSVPDEDCMVGAIGRGLCVLACVVKGDGPEQAEWMAGKIARLRIFPDEAGRFDRNVVDAGGAVLLVSQFTLAADCARGNRPGFSDAAPPDEARLLLEHLRRELEDRYGLAVATGRFAADMRVALVNDGPVTISLRSPAPTP